MMPVKISKNARSRMMQRNKNSLAFRANGKRNVRSTLRCERLEPRCMLTTGAIGDQFVVAEAAGFTDTPAAIAVLADATFTMAWESFQEDGSGFGIFAQRFDSHGVPLSSKVLVNSTTDRDQSAPNIAVDAAGNHLVVWQSKGQDGSGFGVYGQWLDYAGTKMGLEFRINTTTEGDQIAPAVAIDGLGRAMVAWQSDGQDGSDWGVYYTRLDAVAGNNYDTSASGDVLVNDSTEGIQKNPTLATAGNGNMVIAWEAIDPLAGDDASLDIYMKIYDSNGVAVSLGEQLVNSDQLRDQVTPSVAMDTSGNCVIVWVAGGIPGSGSDVFGQRFDSLGQRRGQQFRVNNTTLAAQVGGVVSMDASGNYLVVWQSVHQDGFSEGIFARHYDSDGNTIIGASIDFVMNTTVEGPQSLPSLAINAAGRGVATWHGTNADHQSAIFGQLLEIPSDSDHLKIGPELEMTQIQTLPGNGASAAMDLQSNSVVVFESYDTDGDAMGVFGQWIDAYGDLVNTPVQVNTSFLGNQGAPAVARDPDPTGNVVVVWQSNHEGDNNIYAQLFTFNGMRIGGEFLVNTTVAGEQTTPVVAMREDGGFVVAWQGETDDGTSDIFAQRFDADGVKLGSEFVVNHFTGTDQIMPALTMNHVGEFAIAWVSSHPMLTIPELDPEKSVFVQWFDAQGLSVGDEVIAHVYVKDAQESPQIGMDAQGNFVVAWQSINQDGSTWGVFGRRFDRIKQPLSESEFQINQETEGLQRLVGLGVEADGKFVVAYESTLPGTDDGISTDIYRREFLADGTSDGVENLVNTWAGGPQIQPVIARTATGNYGIFWSGQGFSHIDGIHGRLYDINLVDDPGEPSRLPLGDQFLVGTTIGFEFSSPAIAIHEDGSFTLAFESFEEDSSGFGVFKQQFLPDGTAIPDSRMQVNTSTLDDQFAPAIATDRYGNTLVVWQSKDTSDFGIFGQWFDAAGAKLGNEFLLNTETVDDQTNPSVAIDEAGRAIVVWQSAGQDGEGLGVYYTSLDPIAEGVADTTPIGDGRLNVSTIGDQQAPKVSASAWDDRFDNNRFIVVWQGPGPVEEGEETEASVEVFARRLDASGGMVGSEFIVNSVLEHDQILPVLGLDREGNAVIVWQAEGQQGSGSDVYARRMNADGTWIGVDAQVNTTKTRPQRLPSVALDGDGQYLITWQSQHQDGYSWGIYRQAFDASGLPVGGEVIVNHRVEGPQTAPVAVSNTSGNAVVAWLGNSATHQPSIFAHLFALPNTEIEGEFILTSYAGLESGAPAAAMDYKRQSVVVWESYSEDGSGVGVFAQMLSETGNPIGNRFLVNQNITQGNQGAPAVARASNGEFVIAWQSEVEEGYDIFARRFNADGAPAGDIFQVNPTAIPGNQKAPAVAMDRSGRYVIAWESDSEDGSRDIFAQFYSSDGQRFDEAFRVNEEIALDQYDPAIAMNADGRFVMVWVSNHPAVLPDTLDTEKSIFVRAFSSDWAPIGETEVLVHRYVKDAQEAPAVGIDKDGRFAVAWQSINQDGNSWGVFMRRFQADMMPIDRREITVNETRMGPQRFAGIGVDEFGRVIVAWQSNSRAELTDGGSGGGSGGGEAGSPEGSSWDIFARQYSWDGSPEGGELPVNTWKLGPQILPVVAQAPGGDLGIFWLGQSSGHVEGVNGRLYESPFNPYHNPINSMDVDDDGDVNPLDVLNIINTINQIGPSIPVGSLPSAPPPYFDVDGDGQITPLDVLIVINHINSNSDGEGESSNDTAVSEMLPDRTRKRPFASRFDLSGKDSLVDRVMQDIDRYWEESSQGIISH